MRQPLFFRAAHDALRTVRQQPPKLLSLQVVPDEHDLRLPFLLCSRYCIASVGNIIFLADEKYALSSDNPPVRWMQIFRPAMLIFIQINRNLDESYLLSVRT